MTAVLIRADASPSIGAGHVMRGLALAEALAERGVSVTFASHALAPALANRIRDAGHAVVPVVADDLGETLAAAGRLDAVAIVVDHYGIDDAYLTSLRGTGARIVVVDDMADRELRVDLVVNPNDESLAGKYHLKPETRLLCGLRYALLRSEFRRARATAAPIGSPVTRLLVTIGGSDPRNLTTTVLRGLGALPFTGHITTIVGPENPHRADVDHAAEPLLKKVIIRAASPDMATSMARADLVITASSTTALEALCLGRPTVTIITADNQRAAATSLANAGLVRLIGDWSEADARSVADAVRDLGADRPERERLSRCASAAVDGLGPQRVAAAILGAKEPE